MNFKERFEGKMVKIDKRGLSHVLLNQSKNFGTVTHQPLHRYKSQSIDVRGFESHAFDQYKKHGESLIKRKSTNLEPINIQQAYSVSPSPRKRMNAVQKNYCFLDEMLEKHKNLLSLIDKRSKYKVQTGAGQTRINDNR